MAPRPKTIRFSRVVDLSQPIGPRTQMFPAYPAPTFTQWTTRQVHGFFAESLFMVSHTGTHVDAPFHFEPKGRKLHQLSIDRFIVPGHVLDLRGLRAKGRITPRLLERARGSGGVAIRKGDAIFLRTGWERRGGTPAYLFQNPGLGGDAARRLVIWGAGLVGIDTANIDHPDDTAYPAHHALLRANVPIVENVANLAVLGSSRFFVVALPLRLKGTSGSPIRLVALVD
jgi:kynurenine formamidase